MQKILFTFQCITIRIIPNFCGLKFCDLIYITFCDSFIHDFEV